MIHKKEIIQEITRLDEMLNRDAREVNSNGGTQDDVLVGAVRALRWVIEDESSGGSLIDDLGY